MKEDMDVEWIETVAVDSEPVRLDFDLETGQGFLPEK
jgi:hypothetical protein